MTNRDDSFELTYQSNHECAKSVIQEKTSTLIYFHFKIPTKNLINFSNKTDETSNLAKIFCKARVRLYGQFIFREM